MTAIFARNGALTITSSKSNPVAITKVTATYAIQDIKVHHVVFSSEKGLTLTPDKETKIDMPCVAFPCAPLKFAIYFKFENKAEKEKAEVHLRNNERICAEWKAGIFGSPPFSATLDYPYVDEKSNARFDHLLRAVRHVAAIADTKKNISIGNTLRTMSDGVERRVSDGGPLTDAEKKGMLFNAMVMVRVASMMLGIVNHSVDSEGLLEVEPDLFLACQRLSSMLRSHNSSLVQRVDLWTSMLQLPPVPESSRNLKHLTELAGACSDFVSPIVQALPFGEALVGIVSAIYTVIVRCDLLQESAENLSKALTRNVKLMMECLKRCKEGSDAYASFFEEYESNLRNGYKILKKFHTSSILKKLVALQPSELDECEANICKSLGELAHAKVLLTNNVLQVDAGADSANWRGELKAASQLLASRVEEMNQKVDAINGQMTSLNTQVSELSKQGVTSVEKLSRLLELMSTVEQRIVNGGNEMQQRIGDEFEAQHAKITAEIAAAVKENSDSLKAEQRETIGRMMAQHDRHFRQVHVFHEENIELLRMIQSQNKEVAAEGQARFTELHAMLEALSKEQHQSQDEQRIREDLHLQSIQSSMQTMMDAHVQAVRDDLKAQPKVIANQVSQAVAEMLDTLDKKWSNQLSKTISSKDDYKKLMLTKVEILDSKLGEGSQAHVFEATHNGYTVAAKRWNSDSTSAVSREAAIEQIQKVRSVEWLGIVRCYGLAFVGDALYLIMERHGPNMMVALETAANALKEKIPLSFVARWFYQIVNGLAEMHKQCLVHGDVKAQNVTLKFNDHDPPDAVLIDFDSCQDTDREFTAKGNGTIELLSPEVLRRYKETGKIRHTCASEVFQIGKLLALMLKYAYGSKSDHADFSGAAESMFDVDVDSRCDMALVLGFASRWLSKHKTSSNDIAFAQKLRSVLTKESVNHSPFVPGPIVFASSPSPPLSNLSTAQLIETFQQLHVASVVLDWIEKMHITGLKLMTDFVFHHDDMGTTPFKNFRVEVQKLREQDPTYDPQLVCPLGPEKQLVDCDTNETAIVLYYELHVAPDAIGWVRDEKIKGRNLFAPAIEGDVRNSRSFRLDSHRDDFLSILSEALQRPHPRCVKKPSDKPTSVVAPPPPPPAPKYSVSMNVFKSTMTIIALSNDGKYVAASHMTSIDVLNVDKDGSSVMLRVNHREGDKGFESPSSLVFSPEGKHLLVAITRVVFYNVYEGKPECGMLQMGPADPVGKINCMSFVGATHVLVTVSDAGMTCLWDCSNQSMLRKWSWKTPSNQPQPVKFLAVSCQPPYLALVAAPFPQRLGLWDLNSNDSQLSLVAAELCKIVGQVQMPIRGIDLSQDGLRAIVAFGTPVSGKEVHVLGVSSAGASFTLSLLFKIAEDGMKVAKFTTTANRIMTAGASKSLTIWNDASKLCSLQGIHSESIHAVCLAPKTGTRLITVDEKGSCTWWDGESMPLHVQGAPRLLSEVLNDSSAWYSQ